MKNPQIMTDLNISKLTIHSVPDRPGIAAEIFGRLGEEGLNVSMMTASGGASGRTDISFTVGDDDAAKTLSLLDGLRSELEAERISQRDDVVSVSMMAGIRCGSWLMSRAGWKSRKSGLWAIACMISRQLGVTGMWPSVAPLDTVVMRCTRLMPR